MWARSAFTSIVRCRTSRWRVRCSISTDCCSASFTGTKRIDGRVPCAPASRSGAATTHFTGIQPVRRIGERAVSLTFVDPLRVLPIRIKAGALGKNLPVRDLLVHRPCHFGRRHFVREADVPNTIVYCYIELDNHALILAEVCRAAAMAGAAALAA